MKKFLKIKITLLALVAFLAIFQMPSVNVFVKDVNLLSYQLTALANDEGSTTTKEVDCYANVSDTFFNAKAYVRCNKLVPCADTYGKNPQDQAKCYK